METSEEAEDSASIAAWQVFLTRYAAGEFEPDSSPPIPPIPHSLVRPYDPNFTPVPWAYANAPLYSSSSQVTFEDARAIRNYYCENHYLPPPRSPYENLRHQTINDYDLYSPKQLLNIQAATEVIAEFFPGTLCTFSLFHDHIQKHYCPAGDQDLISKFGILPGLRIPSEDSLCGHAVLHLDAPFFVGNLQQDWRYRNNPFVYAGFRSYIGSSVSLPLDTREDGGKRISVGTLNVCFVKETIAEMTPSQRRVLRHVTSMLETQLVATWDGDQRSKEGRARVLLSDLIDTALVDIRLDEEPSEGVSSLATKTLERLCKILPDVNCIALLSTGGVEMVCPSKIRLILGRKIHTRRRNSKRGHGICWTSNRPHSSTATPRLYKSSPRSNCLSGRT